MGTFIDLTGKQFGNLTVLSRVERRGKPPIWKCRCVCGVIKNVRGQSLRIGRTKSCGCLHKKIVPKIGDKYGRLTIMGYLGLDGKSCRMWECLCVCGNKTVVTTSSLNFKTTQSCGCLQKDFITNFAKSSVIDLRGERFGRLLVKTQQENDSKGRVVWKCSCKCGNEIDVVGSRLRKGTTRSCGCLKIQRSRMWATSKMFRMKATMWVQSKIKDGTHPSLKHGKYVQDQGF